MKNAMKTMSETVNSRIKGVRTHFFNGSNVKFAECIGENANTTSNWVREGYNVGRGVVSKIAEKLPVNLNWLLLGEGEMLRSNNQNISSSPNSTIIGNGNVLSSDTVEKISKNYQEVISTIQVQINKMQQQIDRLIGIIEKMK